MSTSQHSSASNAAATSTSDLSAPNIAAPSSLNNELPQNSQSFVGIQGSLEEMSAAVDILPAAVIVADAPAGVKFADFGLAEPILRAITEMGYVLPTPIQAAAIPIVLQGKDVMGAAQTGTGKTAGFGLPSLQSIMQYANTSPSPARHPTRVLVLAPTRELADQIHDNMKDYAKYTGIRSVAVFGGVDIKPQTAMLRTGCEVLIATPGRLLDHVGQKSANLSQVQMLVLDEADRMLDMGFMPDIQRIINLLPEKRQNLLFSATFSTEIRKLAKTILTAPVVIEVARANQTADNVVQKVLKVPSSDSKKLALANWLREHKPNQAIVFCNSKIGCSRLARLLSKDGFNADAIHGDKSQLERLATLEAFKAGTLSLLIATDVAARGLDVADLPVVINFDLPFAAEDYVHRIGRTGRAGASGIATSLMAPGDERLLADIEKLIKRKIDVEMAVAAHPEVANFGDTQERVRRDSSRDSSRGDDSRRDDSSNSRRRPPVAAAKSNFAGSSRDSFFFQPYVETVPTATLASAAQVGDAMVDLTNSVQPVAKRFGLTKAARPVAMLLGGGKKA